MKIENKEIIVKKSQIGLLSNFREVISEQIQNIGKPIRFVIVKSNDTEYICEVDILCDDNAFPPTQDIFTYYKRSFENTNEFNIAFSIPTGIGAEIGGHAGDANAVCRLFGSICDNLITHPNCVNAANYNEQPPNTLYVEGSTFTKLFMGTVGLAKTRNNRTLLLVDKYVKHLNDEIINAASTARMMLGVNCDVHIMENTMVAKAGYSSSGRASGFIDHVEELFNEIDKFINRHNHVSKQNPYDAIALSTYLNMPHSNYDDYFVNNTINTNPWGSPEAMITHTVSDRYHIPCAHAPLMSKEAAAKAGTYGIVDPRKAPESESVADIYCCLKGLQKAPRLVSPENGLNSSNISCLVIPYGCVGLPVLAAFDQSIPVIAVKENTNLMRNRYSDYDFDNKILYEVNNYWEALGVCQAIKAGIDPKVVRRPILATRSI